jgi:putative transposase
MDKVRYGSHTRYDLKIHLVFIPKGRARVLRGDVGLHMGMLLKQICNELDVEIITGKLAIDHVHLFLSYPTSISVADLAQRLKGKSSYKIMNFFPHLRKEFWGKHFWARGYFAVSSGNITDEIIQKYIQDQEGQDLHQGDIEVSS